MDPTFALRRDLPISLDDVGEETDLAERIRDEIRRNGPMPFARFMELALYDPDGGYYHGATARPGRVGDFITGPELDPIFGATLSTAIIEIWERLGRPDPFTIRELGAGVGTLALAILRAIKDEAFRAAVRYQVVEVDSRRATAATDALAAAGFGDVIVPDEGRSMVGVVLANEVLDALPVHRVRQRSTDLVELAVELAVDGTLREVEMAPTTDLLAARLADEEVVLVDGQTAEICLGLDAWLRDAVAPLDRGALLLIDYGAPADELYDPVRRRDGTLRAYVRHQVHDDPYRHVGRQDLTAHVDVTAVERAATAAGLATLGITTQMEALVGLGIEGRWAALRDDPATTLETYTTARASISRLLDPAVMGRFRVMAFGRDWPTADQQDAHDDHDEPLTMFAFRLPDRRR